MPTNNFPNIKKKTLGKDFNFFKKLDIVALNFGDQTVNGEQPDIIITFSTKGILLMNEGTTSSQVVEYSFNGNTIHGELDPSLPSKVMSFDNRVISMMWFRIKPGSSGPVTVRIDAW